MANLAKRSRVLRPKTLGIASPGQIIVPVINKSVCNNSDEIKSMTLNFRKGPTGFSLRYYVKGLVHGDLFRVRNTIGSNYIRAFYDPSSRSIGIAARQGYSGQESSFTLRAEVFADSNRWYELLFSFRNYGPVVVSTASREQSFNFQTGNDQLDFTEMYETLGRLEMYLPGDGCIDDLALYNDFLEADERTETYSLSPKNLNNLSVVPNYYFFLSGFDSSNMSDNKTSASGKFTDIHISGGIEPSTEEALVLDYERKTLQEPDPPATNESPVFTDAGPIMHSSAQGTTGNTYGSENPATDPNPGHSIIYSLTGPDAHFFTVDPSTGVISQKPLTHYNFSQKNTYTFSLVATDDGTPILQAIQSHILNITEPPMPMYREAIPSDADYLDLSNLPDTLSRDTTVQDHIFGCIWLPTRPSSGVTPFGTPEAFKPSLQDPNHITKDIITGILMKRILNSCATEGFGSDLYCDAFIFVKEKQIPTVQHLMSQSACQEWEVSLETQSNTETTYQVSSIIFQINGVKKQYVYAG